MCGSYEVHLIRLNLAVKIGSPRRVIPIPAKPPAAFTSASTRRPCRSGVQQLQCFERENALPITTAIISSVRRG